MKVVILLASICLLSSAQLFLNDEPLDVVPYVDIQRYLGVWYEIARFPQKFETGLVCITATYSLNSDGTIKVHNSARKGSSSGPISEIDGKAWAVNQGNSKLKVQFFWPFSSDYWIIDLDPEYQWALIGEPKRQFGYILSRQPTIDQTIFDKLTNEFTAKGWDISQLIMADQSCSQQQQ
jgi:apolipoprotein D and lipocalin family protein